GTPQHTVSTLGGVVTLHGANLAQVSAVHLGGATVRSFYTHTDTTIAFPAPAHRHGAVAVTVSTSWHARSQPVTVTYVAPRPSRRITLDPGASAPPTTSAPPSSTAPPMTIGGASSSTPSPSASGH
ncbi:IPT/TIG domain-containing protein, partial [Jatrophihabitans endophyticus]|uniref:IPT/TIG domain-containing protein n=1 Tax=Jatrophihabitans endophyticus TaxID=1206085 RepID=UPI0019E7C865